MHEGLSHIHSSACTTCHIRSGACHAMFNLRYKLFLTSFASRYIDDYKMTRTLKAWHYMAAFAVYLALLTILIVHVLGIYCHTITNPQIAASVAFFLLKGPFLLYKLYPPVVATPKIFHDIDSLEKLRLHTTSLGVIINGTLEFKIQENHQLAQHNAFLEWQ